MFSNWRPYSRQYVSRYVIYMISGDLRLLEGYLECDNTNMLTDRVFDKK